MRLNVTKISSILITLIFSKTFKLCPHFIPMHAHMCKSIGVFTCSALSEKKYVCMHIVQYKIKYFCFTEYFCVFVHNFHSLYTLPDRNCASQTLKKLDFLPESTQTSAASAICM